MLFISRLSEIITSTSTSSAAAAAAPASAPTSTSTTAATLTAYQGELVLWLVVAGIILAGIVVFAGRWVLKGTQDDQAATFIRSWLAISLVIGLLIFCGATLLSSNTSLQSTLFGGLVASTGAAIAFYFSSKGTEQARADILGAVTAISQGNATGPSAFSAITPPGGTNGTAYNYRIEANGIPAPTYQLVTGSLPTGLTLDADGTLHGTPTAPATYTFQVGAFNSSGLLVSPELSITIS
jgi:Putative Ig domain